MYYSRTPRMVNRCDIAGQQQLNELVGKTSSGKGKLQQCFIYRQKLLADLSERAARMQRHTQHFNDIVTELTRLRRQHITDLITYIFPVSELPASRLSVLG